MLKSDILRTYNMSKGNKYKRYIGCFREIGVQAVIIFRFGQWITKSNMVVKILLTPFYIFFYWRIRKWGIEIPRTVSIGEGLYIGHYGGITISPLAIIGKNLNLSHSVTIGVSGDGEKRGAPRIGDNVYIAAGAKIFGKITIGNNVKIGANAVIHKSIPDNAIAVAYPGYKIISYDGNKIKTKTL